ncbi:unnamed protein product [Amaranthus hypochondriacus]
MDPEDLDSWRIFFRNSGYDIFVIINKAIMVAAKDYPSHMKLRRDQIICNLYQLCFPCQPEVSIPMNEAKNTVVKSTHFRNYCEGHNDHNKRVDHVDDNLFLVQDNCFNIECNGEKKIAEPTNEVKGSNTQMAIDGQEDRNSRVQSHKQHFPLTEAKNTVVKDISNSKELGSDGGSNEGLKKNGAKGSHYIKERGLLFKQMGGSPFEQAEVSKNLINECSETSKEVLKIKNILENYQNHSDLVLVELLTKLERMNLNIQILEETLIGKAVNVLRKHGLKEIRKISRSLVRGWKTKVDKLLQAEAAIKEVRTSAVDRPPKPFNERDAVAPSVSELLKIFEGVNEEEFFSILPPENINGKFSFADKLDFDEEDEHLVHKNSGRDGMDEAREEELLIKRNLLHLQGTSSFEENRSPQTDKNKLERDDKMNSVKNKESAMKLGDHFPFLRTPKRDRYRKSMVETNASENAFKTRRVPLLPHAQHVRKLEEPTREQGRCRKVVVRQSVALHSRLKHQEPFEHRMVNSSPKDKVEVSRRIKQLAVEGKRRMSMEGEGLGDAQNANKQHAGHNLKSNHRHLKHEHKRHKHHH